MKINIASLVFQALKLQWDSSFLFHAVLTDRFNPHTGEYDGDDAQIVKIRLEQVVKHGNELEQQSKKIIDKIYKAEPVGDDDWRNLQRLDNLNGTNKTQQLKATQRLENFKREVKNKNKKA